MVSFFSPLKQDYVSAIYQAFGYRKKELKVFLEFSRTMLSRILDMLP